MTDSISFGKKQQAGKVDLKKVKDGLTKQEIAGNDKKLQSIFDKVDTNRNEVLEKDELLAFQKKLTELAGEDNQLTDKEAKGFKDADGHKMGRRHRKAFYEFLNKLAANEQEPQPAQQPELEVQAPQTNADNLIEIPETIQSTVSAQVADEIVDTDDDDTSLETGDETIIEPEEEPEPEVTSGIIVQNGESPAVIAKKFGVSVEDLLAANEGAVKGKGNKKYFLVGQEIVIPRKIEDEELAELTKNRKSAAETTGDYTQAMARREQRRAEAREAAALQEAQYKEMGLINHEGQGEKVTGKYKGGKTEEFTVIGQAGRGRVLAKGKNGKIVTIAHDGTILKNEYVQNTERYEAAREFNQNLTTRKNAEKLAKQFYQIADENSGNTSMKKMAQLLDANVNEDNIVAFLDAYSKDSIKKGDSSIVDTITSEVTASESQQRKVLVKIMNKLTAAAQKAGVSSGDINKAVQDFNAAMNKEFSAHLRRTNPLEMENAIDFLRGAIVAKRTGNSGEMTDAQAIAAFNSDFSATDSQVQKDYADARAAEGWAAGVGDTVCGWFGCKTVEEMDKKLGVNAAAVKKLAAAKTEAEFKTAYKQVFGIDFDKNKIAARDAALWNYQQAQGLSSTINITSGILKKAGSLDYAGLRNEIKSKFQLDDQTVDQIIQNYGLTSGKEVNSDSDKQTMLMKFLQETQNESAASYRALTKGKTLEQMGKDLELLHNSAFGTNNISREVAQFNENMVITEMVTEGVFEVAGTIALQFVPGLGQAAAARLAVSAARWGSKAVKITNAAVKAEKAFATAKRLQTGANLTGKTQKAAQIGSQMLSAGVATATVDASNGRDAKTVMRKTLMNMSFAGVGASSSMLAPKLMQSFGITNKALANEIAEEIMNAAGSYGITKLAGDDYGSTDAFIDFATGLIMSRIAHIKTSSSSAEHVIDMNHPSHDAEIVNNSVHNEQRQADHHAGYLRKRQQEADKLAVDMDPNQNIVTPEQQAAYDREIAYQPVPEADRPAFEAHQQQVAQAHAEAHELGNMVDASSAEALQRAKANIEADAPAPAPAATKPDAPIAPNQAEIENLTQSLADIDKQIARAESNLASKARRGKQPTLQEKQQLERMKANRAAKQAELDALQKPAAAEPVVKAEDAEPVIKPDEAEPVARVEDAEPIITPEEIPTPESIARDAQAIPEVSIPAEHRNLWKSCQERINKIFSGAGKLAMGEVKTVLADIKTLYNAVKNVQVKANIKKLYNKLVTLAKSEPRQTTTKEYKLSTAQREKMMDKFEIFHQEFLDINYLRNKYPQYNSLSDTELLKKFALNEDHAAFVMNRKDLFGNGQYMERQYWNDSPFELSNNHSAWKMHLFSVDTNDYQQMAEIILPYLNKHKIAHKTLSSTMSPELLATSAPEQTGKAFTIYPQSQEEMEMIAKDLDRLIRQNNLTTGNSHITGDNQLGDSGRLFYRYEFPTGKLKDKIYKPGEHAPYDRNRGEGNYLASDMTPADDPWLNFDPSNPNSKVGQAAPAQPQAPAAPRGVSPQEIGEIGDAINRARNNYSLDQAQAKINRLPDSPQKATLQRQANEKARLLRQAEEPVSAPRQQTSEPYIVDVSEQANVHEIVEVSADDVIAIPDNEVIMIDVDAVVTRHPNEISSAIDTAYTEVEFTALQNEIDSITNPSTKQKLQAKLDRKRQEANYYPDLADYNQNHSVNNEPYYDPANDPANWGMLDDGIHGLADDFGGFDPF
ncbi:MAG: LysM peptidoglycan-binding domain-containing protein [Fusobacterium sp.]|nr:LysM peptidoglycan-binding domain-containing protein [Fusobacterium sp.]